MKENKSFEESYAAYPFPLLVDFGLALSNLFVRTRARRVQTEERRPEGIAFGR